MSKGLFITLEGGDGAGKSTQIEFIKQFFESRGKKVIVTREPGGTSISEKLREILLDAGNSEMASNTEMLIYAAARAQIVAELIKPAVERGEIVICDRFLDSSVAYQGYGRNLGDAVAIVNSYATEGLKPDVTFWMNIDPELGRKRIGSRADSSLDRLEKEKLDFHYRVYNGYKAIAEAEPERVRSIDASRTIDEIKADVQSILENICKERGL